MLFASTKVCCIFVSPMSLGNTARMPCASVRRRREYLHTHAVHVHVLSGDEHYDGDGMERKRHPFPALSELRLTEQPSGVRNG